MTVIKLLLIGGSAGALDLLMQVLPELRPGLSFPVVIILHRKNDADSILGVLLSTVSSSQVKEIEDKEALKPGVIYLAPADYHVLIEKDGTASLDVSEKVHFCRPCIDITLESAAFAFPGQLAGMVLSGANADGTEGLKAIHLTGGIVSIQDPGDAIVSYMPENVLSQIKVDNILSNSKIASFINDL